MRTEYIKYLLSIQNNQSISAAAEELYLGQTTLSSVVRRVEDEIGVPIFRRTHAGVAVTPEGETALALMGGIDACLQKIDQIKNRPAVSQSIPFLTSPCLSYGFSLPVSLMLLEDFPGENLEFRVSTGSEVVPRIIKSESDLGITYLSAKEYKKYRSATGRYRICVEPLFTDRMYLLVRADSPLAERATIPAAELKTLDLAMLAHFNIGEDALAYKVQLGSGHCYTTYPNIRLIKQAVLTQNVGAVLSGFAIFQDDSFPQEGFRTIRLLYPGEADHRVQACLIYRDRDSLSAVETHILERIRNRFKGLRIPAPGLEEPD